jgi:hypothetical protein
MATVKGAACGSVTIVKILTAGNAGKEDKVDGVNRNFDFGYGMESDKTGDTK